MTGKRILTGVVISILIACIVYFGCKLANADAQDPQGTSMSLPEVAEVVMPSDAQRVVKQYEGFTSYFNPERHAPDCVAWILHRDETDGTSARSNRFWTDADVEGCASTSDYTRSGYDRGHLCPAGEQKWSQAAMHDSFVMTNICPQKHELNSGAWKTLEEKERIWADRDSILVIAAGPIYNSPHPERIGATGVAVPDAFFKVLLAPFADEPRAIAFVYPNMKCQGNMENYATTVDEVERITGIDFFSALPDDVEAEIESSASFKEWNQQKRDKQ